MGNESEVSIFDGMTVLKVAPEPCSLKLTNASEAKLAEKLLEVTPDGVVAPGRDYRILINVFNPLKCDAVFWLELADLVLGLTAKKLREVKVKPGQKATEAFPIKVFDASAIGDTTLLGLMVRYRLVDTPWIGSARNPVNIAKAIPA